MKIWIVDVFTSQAFKGNPAAVCILGKFPDADLMQNIALEMNLSQTAFIVKRNQSHSAAKAHYSIRWFTPTSEAPLCAHATIAAMHVLTTETLTIADQEVVIFETFNNRQLIAVKQKDEIQLTLPRFLITEDRTLGETVSNITEQNPSFTGTSENCIVAEFANEDTIYKISPDFRALQKLPYRALIITSKSEREEYDYIYRYFAPRAGINEDPVCGSSHCRLTPYWAVKLGKSNFIAYSASKRGGTVKTILSENNVIVAGNAVTTIHCEYRIPF